MVLFTRGFDDLAYLIANEVNVRPLVIFKKMLLHELVDGANNPCLLRLRSRLQRRDGRVTTCVEMELDRLVYFKRRVHCAGGQEAVLIS